MKGRKRCLINVCDLFSRLTEPVTFRELLLYIEIITPTDPDGSLGESYFFTRIKLYLNKSVIPKFIRKCTTNGAKILFVSK